MKNKIEYNGWCGDQALIAMKADKFSDDFITETVDPTKRQIEKRFAYLTFWGYMRGYNDALKKTRRAKPPKRQKRTDR